MQHCSKWLLIISITTLASCFNSDNETANTDLEQSSNVNAQENLLSDNQIKAVRHNAQAILKSRKLQQDAQTQESRVSKQQLQKIQAVVQNVEHELSRLQYIPVYQPRTLKVKSVEINHLPELQLLDHQQNQSGKAQIQQKPADRKINHAQVKEENEKKGLQTVVESARLGIKDIKSVLQPESILKTFFNKNDLNNKVPASQRTILLEKINEVEKVLLEIEKDEANALQKVKRLNKQLKLYKPELHMKDTTPTITFVHSSDNTEK